MFNLLYAELLKLKRAKIWWLILGAAILPGQLDIVVALDANGGQLAKGAEQLFFNNILLLDVPVIQVVLSVLAGYLFGREYSEKTINTLFTYPFPRRKVYYSKMIVLFLLLVVFFVAAFLSVLSVTWTFVGNVLTADVLVRLLGYYLLSAVLNFALIPVYALVTLIGKNIVSSIVCGITMMIANGFLLSTGYEAWSPWNLPLLLKVSMMDPLGRVPFRLEEPMYAVAALAGMFLVPFVLSVIYLEKSDVHSGS